MDSQDKLYMYLIVTFFGFIIFIISVLSKKITFLSFLSVYFVLVLLCGIIISGIGLMLVLMWHVGNARPYYEGSKEDFSNYLGFGIFLLLASVFIVSFFNLGKIVFYATLILSSIGILLLVLGLKYYIKETFRKNPAHS